jgi:hypothetical protein
MKNYEHFPIEDFENIRDSLSKQYSFLCDGYSNVSKSVPWNSNTFPILFERVRNSVSDIQLKVEACRLFLTPPARVLQCHIDGREINKNYWALNIPIVIPEQDHYQEWLEYSGAIADNQDATYDAYIKPAETDKRFFKIIDRVTVDRPYLVRIGTWHRVVNNTPQYRLILSLRFDQTTTEKLLDKFNIDYK